MPLARGRRSRTRPRDRLGYEQVRAAIVRPAQELDGSVAPAERALERGAGGHAPLERERRIGAFDGLEVGGDLREQVSLAARRVLQDRPGASGAQHVADALAFGVVKRRW